MTQAAPILVVEDDEAILGTIADILSSAGYGVVTAEHGARALDILVVNATP